jgi:hypothetical protein
MKAQCWRSDILTNLHARIETRSLVECVVRELELAEAQLVTLREIAQQYVTFVDTMSTDLGQVETMYHRFKAVLDADQRTGACTSGSQTSPLREIAMRAAVLFLSWTLLATATTFECQHTQCQLSPSSAMVTHPVMTFPSQNACEAQRQQMDRVPATVVQVPSQPGLTITKQLTYVCVEGKDQR